MMKVSSVIRRVQFSAAVFPRLQIRSLRLLTLATLMASTGWAAAPPNLVIILADDMDADRTELHDLAAAQPEKVKDMQAKWDAWNATLVKPLWGGEPSGANAAQPGIEKKPGRKQ